MSCRIQNLEQTRLKWEELKKKSLNRDIDLFVSFYKIRISKKRYDHVSDISFKYL